MSNRLDTANLVAWHENLPVMDYTNRAGAITKKLDEVNLKQSLTCSAIV